MMVFENIKLAFKSMFTNKMRTVLSLLGIVIGVASVVAILTLGTSATKSITSSFENGGLDTISITTKSGKRTGDTFTEEFAETLKRTIDGIDLVMCVNTTSSKVRNLKNIETYTVYGVPSNYAQVMNCNVESGNWFTSEDNIFKRQVVVLGATVASVLFPDGNAVGQYVSIFRKQSKRYLVIGVLEEKEASLTGVYDSCVFIPYNTYSQRFMKVNAVGTYILKVNPDYDSVSVGENVSEYLDNLVGSDYFSVFSAATLQEMAANVTGTFSTFLAAIAGISLLVGGIGIMNIMLVSVAERTKEIGIRKALGASPRVIRGQFITESIALTLVGGILGILLGTILSYLVTRIADWNFHLSVSSYILSVGFSMAIGVFFGWYPAKKASGLDPIASLNYE